MAVSSSSSSLLRIGNNYNNDQFQLFSHSSNNNGFRLLSSAALKLKPSTKTFRIICAVANDNTNNNSSNSNSKSNSKSDKGNGLVEESSSCHVPILFNKSVAYHTRGPSVPEKLVVAVDEIHCGRYSWNHSLSEYHVYEFFKVPIDRKVKLQYADIRVHEFYKTSYFETGIRPIPGARQALQKLSRLRNLSVVTSRQIAIKDLTIEWVGTHFPGVFQEIHFGNHFALEGQGRPKSDICRSLGAKVLIDDNPTYAADCAEAGIKVLLFVYENSYPWCRTDSVAQHPPVVKVHKLGRGGTSVSFNDCFKKNSPFIDS